MMINKNLNDINGNKQKIIKFNNEADIQNDCKY